MHSTITFSALTIALSSNVFAAPLNQVRQDSLTLADTVQFIAKSVGPNPNPDINNFLFMPVHAGAGINIVTLVDPSTTSFDLSEPGYFRNGSDATHGEGGYLTAGFVVGTIPYSLVLDVGHEANSSNSGAEVGPVEFNIGVGTDGLDVFAGIFITSEYISDLFWACPNIPIEGGGVAIVVEATNRYADPPTGCWSIQLYAQCAGPISDANRAGFPAFLQSSCYANATSVVATE